MSYKTQPRTYQGWSEEGEGAVHGESILTIPVVRDNLPGGGAMQRWEYATMEWIWAAGEMRITLPGRDETLRRGSYVEVVATLCELGRECWEVVGKAAAGDWIFWTLKRPLE